MNTLLFFSQKLHIKALFHIFTQRGEGKEGEGDLSFSSWLAVALGRGRGVSFFGNLGGRGSNIEGCLGKSAPTSKGTLNKLFRGRLSISPKIKPQNSIFRKLFFSKKWHWSQNRAAQPNPFCWRVVERRNDGSTFLFRSRPKKKHFEVVMGKSGEGSVINYYFHFFSALLLTRHPRIFFLLGTDGNFPFFCGLEPKNFVRKVEIFFLIQTSF